MDAFATLDDYEARFGEVPESDAARVETLLGDASALVLSLLPDGWEGDAAAVANLPRVTCTVAQRALDDLSEGTSGVESYQQTAGSYSAIWKPVNPSGGMYLTGAEKAALHIGGGAGFASPYSRRAEP